MYCMLFSRGNDRAPPRPSYFDYDTQPVPENQQGVQNPDQRIFFFFFSFVFLLSSLATYFVFVFQLLFVQTVSDRFDIL